MLGLMQIHEPGETPDPHAGEESVAIGIDLGTTNSVVSIITDNKPQVITDSIGNALLPSVVAYREGGEILVGIPAQQELLTNPDNVISSVKRLMGRGIADIPDLEGVLPYELTDDLKTALKDLKASGQKPKGSIKLEVADKTVSPVEISSEILKHLKIQAEHAIGKKVTKAVITVPAYFDDSARTATKDAARLAGLEVLRLVNEPTAAALAYGLDEEEKGNPANGIYAVYDFGGGTFDISILKLQQGVFQVLSTGGDASLGGDDLDHAIAQHMLKQQDGSADNSGEVKQLLATARQIKEILTTEPECEVGFGNTQKQTSFTLSREQLDKIIKPLIDKTLAACANTVKDADLTLGDIHGVILVGGSTRVPAVRAAVQKFFNKPPLTQIDPDKVVAVGAARQAHALTHGSDTLLLDVLPLSLGLETMGGIVEKIIDRNTPIPVSKAQEFTTYQDGQTAMLIHVLQGERETVEDNRSLAQFNLNGIPALVAGSARIQVVFTVDADGILTVSATEKTTGTTTRVEVKPSYGLSEEDMTQMLRDSLEHATEDVEKRLLIEQRINAQQMLNILATALSKDFDLLEKADREAIDTKRLELERLVKSDDRSAIRECAEALEKLTQPFAEARVNRALSESLSGKDIDTV